MQVPGCSADLLSVMRALAGPRRVLVAVLVGLPVLVMTPSASASPADPVVASQQVIVLRAPGTSDAVKAAALRSVPVASRTAISPDMPGAPSVDVVDVGGPRSAALGSLASNPDVTSVEPNGVVRRVGAPTVDLASSFNDPLLIDGTRWQLLSDSTGPANKYGINAVGAWRRGVTGDPNIYVGIVDDGVDTSHPDLAQNVFTNRWDPPNGRDDDHNGRVDDTHGWDFVNADNTVFDGQQPFDFIDAHGTVVAGEISEVQNNGLGGSGAAPTVKVIPAKFIGAFDGTIANAIAALDYLTDRKRRHGLNIVASNNSWGGDDANSPALQAAIQRGADAGIVFVNAVADGDPGTGLGYDVDRRPDYPASLNCQLPSGADCMLVATAIDDHGRLPDFVNWGKRTVDLAAPGVGVTSTFPFADYLGYDGTSMAAPLVSAAVALYRSRYPSASPTRARDAILRSTTDTPSLRGKTATGGRLDVQAMLNIGPG